MSVQRLCRSTRTLAVDYDARGAVPGEGRHLIPIAHRGARRRGDEYEREAPAKIEKERSQRRALTNHEPLPDQRLRRPEDLGASGAQGCPVRSSI